MGYTTQFNGELKFTNELSAPALAYLSSFLGKDRRDIGYKDDSVYKNGKYGTYWYHIDYELTEEFDGIRWNGAEKAYDMEHIANFLIDKMKEKFSDFGLEGEMYAQGEEWDDRWVLAIKNGRAEKNRVVIKGKKVKCPACGEDFVLEEGEVK